MENTGLCSHSRSDTKGALLTFYRGFKWKQEARILGAALKLKLVKMGDQ